MQITTDKKKWNELTYTEKHSRCNRIRAICAMGDIEALKKLIPTTEELLAYVDMNNGGSFLHTLMYSGESKTNTPDQVEFLKQVFKEYGLDENEEARRKLLLRKNARGKYAADFTYALNFTSHSIKATFDELVGKTVPTQLEPDTRTDFEKNKVTLYTILKAEIIKVRPPAQKSDVHKIGHDYSPHEQHSTEKSGTPTTGGMYIPDKDGNPALYILGSIRETYPVIKLRNIDEYGDDVAIIENLDPNSPKGLREQALAKIDFPEDFIHHFKALEEFEQTYQNMRDDPDQFAFMRNFVQQRGSLIFEDQRDPDVNGNTKSGYDYGGYACEKIVNGEKFPCIVVRSDYASTAKSDWKSKTSTLLHELYHRVDLSKDINLSQLPITQYVLMLSEQNPNTPIKDAHKIVNEAYPPTEYEKEVIAQLMSITDKDTLGSSPLLRNFYALGKYFATAKADKCPALMHRIAHAHEILPEETLIQLHSEYLDFKKAKERQYTDEENISKLFPEDEHECNRQIKASRNRFTIEFQQKNQEKEAQRKLQETRLLNCIISIARYAQILQENPKLGEIIMPPIAYKLTASSPRPIEEAIAPYYKSKIHPQMIEHRIKTISVYGKLQKGEEINSIYATELIKTAYMCEQLFKQKFPKSTLPEQLPSFSCMTKKTFEHSPEQYAKSMQLFTEAIKNNASEFQLRASLYCNKPINHLTNEDYLMFNIEDANNRCRYQNKSSMFRYPEQIKDDIQQCLNIEFEKAGYKKEDIPDFFAISEENGKNPPYYKNIAAVVPYIKQGYTPELLKEIFTIAATSPKNVEQTIQKYTNNIPMQDRFKEGTTPYRRIPQLLARQEI